MKKNRMMKDNGARGINFQGAAEATDDLRQYFEVGVVRGDGGDNFEILDGQVWVDVVIMPTEAPMTCRLSTVAGAPGNGVWMVPPEGTEVAIAFPGGSVENGGIIIGILSAAPGGTAEGRIVIVADEVILGNPSGQNALQNGVVVGGGIDPFTGQTYATLQNASSKVLAEK